MTPKRRIVRKLFQQATNDFFDGLGSYPVLGQEPRAGSGNGLPILVASSVSTCGSASDERCDSFWFEVMRVDGKRHIDLID